MRGGDRERGDDCLARARISFVDTLAHTVTRDGEPVRLTPKEFDLLLMLVRHAGRVVTHRQLLSAIWGPAHVESTQYLRVFIVSLR